MKCSGFMRAKGGTPNGPFQVSKKGLVVTQASVRSVCFYVGETGPKSKRPAGVRAGTSLTASPLSASLQYIRGRHSRDGATA